MIGAEEERVPVPDELSRAAHGSTIETSVNATSRRQLSKRGHAALITRIAVAGSPEELEFLSRNIEQFFFGAEAEDLVQWIRERRRDMRG